MPRTLKEIEKSKRPTLDTEQGSLDKALKHLVKFGTTILAAINSETKPEAKASTKDKSEKSH